MTETTDAVRAAQNGAPPATARPRPSPLRTGNPAVASVGLLGTGSCIPERVLTNLDLERLVDTTDEWIIARTGIRERRLAAPGQTVSDLAAAAGARALAESGLAAADLQLIIVATVTPDQYCPPASCHVQRKLGASSAAGFDVNVACSGFANALMIGHNLVATGAFGNALVIGADVLSAITDYEDRGSCILFGDGAGAVVLVPEPANRRILDHVVGIDGTGADLIELPAGGSAKPASQETVARREHFLRLDGRQVFRFAVGKMAEVVEELAARNGIEVRDIDLLIPHQANLRIIDAAASRLGIPMERVLVNIDRFGNTSAASIPVALDEAVQSGRLREGDLVCLVAFGGGLSWGASLIEW